MKKQSRRRFSAEFRAQAVEWVGLGKPDLAFLVVAGARIRFREMAWI
jgi:hypothetical protein